MKRIGLVVFGIVLAFCALAQSNAALSGTHWRIQGDQMAGLGTHRNQEAGTVLSFSASGQWSASNEINGYHTGKWTLDKKGRTVLYFGEKKRGFCRMEGEQLILVVPGVGKERTMVWKKTSK